MGFDSMVRQFRAVCGRFATGVTVIVAETPDGPHGMTANAFMSVSLDPLLVAVAVQRRGRMASLLAAAETAFSVSVLSQDQQHVAEIFSRFGHRRDRVVPELQAIEGRLPVVGGAGAWMWCATESVVPAGDHLLIVARAFDFGYDCAQEPLLFYAGRYWEHMARERDQAVEWLLLER